MIGGDITTDCYQPLLTPAQERQVFTDNEKWARWNAEWAREEEENAQLAAAVRAVKRPSVITWLKVALLVGVVVAPAYAFWRVR